MSPVRPALWTCLAPLLALGLLGCPADDGGADGETSTSETSASETSTETGAPTETSTETGGPCTAEGCACDPEAEAPCDPGLYCSESDQVCTAPACANGVVEEGEECDDGNELEGDGCDQDCTFTELLAVEVGYENTCVLIEGGRVRCWGANGKGELGLGNTEPIGDNETPGTVEDVLLGLPVLDLSVGDSHACVVLDDANARCWGSGASGRLGISNVATVGDDESPMQDVLAGDGVVEIDAGGSHTCARLVDGSMRCWGAGFGGALGYGNPDTIGDDEHPVTIDVVPVGASILAQATGIGHTCVITSEGAVRCWGAGGSGQLGYGNVEDVGVANTPAEVGDAAVVPADVDADAAAIALALGQNISCALYEGGEVLCWGVGFTGALGQGSTADIGDDELPSSFGAIELGAPAIAISAGDSHVCALLDTHEARCWGANTAGQLGLGTLDNLGDDELPTAVAAIDLGGPIAHIDAGGIHTCAIVETTNELYCWGLGSSGQLGYANTANVGDDELPLSAGPVEVF